MRHHSLNRLVTKLDSIISLSDAERAAILELPIQVRDLAADQDIVREGDRPSQCCLVAEGFLCRYKTLPDGSSISPRVDAQYQSSFFTDLTNTQLGQVDGRTLMDARLAWRSPKTDWQVTFAATNLTNKFYYYNIGDGVASGGIISGQPARPREWAVSLKRNF